LNELSGFGIFSMITASFDSLLDLDNIATRHRDDEKLGLEQYSDDAFFVICVDPESPAYLQPVSLEVGQNRYPYDVPRTDRYFPNDSRSESPTLMFDTVEEDLNGNGVLDWGEDSDNDGVLDHPNVYPLDIDMTDPIVVRDNLLNWYERETDTLILRPVMPLREGTTYAVVLTDRLVGEEGEAVRSPWEYVHHLRQTSALQPLTEALPTLGLTIENVAFAWTFTTGDSSTELVSIRRGIYGVGPFASLETEFPAGVNEADQLNEMDGEDPHMLSIPKLTNVLLTLGLIEGESATKMVESFNLFSSYMVGGAFNTPYFLVDKDDGGADDSDEYWQMNTFTGEYEAGSQRIPFSCVLPSPETGAEPPYDVVIFGHGYGSSRFDFFVFSWPFNQYGYAVCAMDFPGHGPTIDDELAELIENALEQNKITNLLVHLRDSRYRDLNNDGLPDSGGDQWTADVFHTRDMVRQAVVDWMQMVKSFKECGTGEMTFSDGTTGKSCDWNRDGTPDIGGEDSEYYIFGGSLGGIATAIAAAVMPEVEAFIPIAAGAGLLDMAMRTEIGGAVEAMQGRLMSPLFLGMPTDDGALELVQMVNSERDMVSLPIATLDSIPVGAKIVIENLSNGESRQGRIPEDGRFRVGIAADAMDPYEKRVATGMPDSGPGLIKSYSVPNNEGLGDQFRILIYSEQGDLLHSIDTWESDVTHEGVTMPAGSPLVAGSYGTGRIGGTPDLRRIASIFSSVLETGEPVTYAPHYFQYPFADLGGLPANVLLMPTAGDSIVPISTGITLARVSGLIDLNHVDQRYGMTVDEWLVDRRVIQGIEEYGEHLCTETADDGSTGTFSCLFDADNSDNSTDQWGAPSNEPLRLSVQTSSGVSGLRIPYVSPFGSHGFAGPEPSRDFDVNSFAINQLLYYILTKGTVISDDVCLEDYSCEWMTAGPFSEVTREEQ